MHRDAPPSMLDKFEQAQLYLRISSADANICA